jgi:hypothetical protein
MFMCVLPAAAYQALRQEEVYGDWEDLEATNDDGDAKKNDDDDDDEDQDDDEDDEGQKDEDEDADKDEGITFEDDGRRLGESKKDAHMRRQKAKDALKSNFDSVYDKGREGGLRYGSVWSFGRPSINQLSTKN